MIVTQLAYRELKAAVELLGVACELDGLEPFPNDFLGEIKRVTHAAVVAYFSIDRRARTSVCVSSPCDLDDLDPELEQELDRHLWNVLDQCPALEYRVRTADMSTVRFSDLISRRAYHALPIYGEYFRPCGVEWGLTAPLPAPPALDRYLMLWRSPSDPDFTATDRDLLEVLRPHLGRMQELAELRRRVADDGASDVALTPREQEILDLVAVGKTNAEIAAELWVAPSTIKKHLENIYAKLDVPGRAAAVNVRRLSI